MKKNFKFAKQVRIIKDKSLVPRLFDNMLKESEGRGFFYIGKIASIDSMITFSENLEYQVKVKEEEDLGKVYNEVIDRYLDLATENINKNHNQSRYNHMNGSNNHNMTANRLHNL